MSSRRRILKLVITRCRTYLKKTDFENGNSNKITRKKSCRNNIFLQCKKHSTEFQDKWHIDSENCEKCINLSINSELPNWKLPKEGNVLLVMLKSLREDPGHKTSPLTNMSLDLMLHWIYCNIYIQSYKTVRKKNEELYKEYKLTKNYIKRVVKPTGIDLINLSKSVELTCLI